MPPVSSKGKGKGQPQNIRRSLSRNTTPVPSGASVQVTVEPSYLRTSMAHLSTPLDMTVEEILDRGGSVSNIPSVRSLSDMRETIQNKFLSHIRRRGEVSDRVLRELSKRRKERVEQERVEQEREKRERADREAEERKHKLKKVKKRDPEEERPLAVGAHGVARQDGVDLHKGKFYSNLLVQTFYIAIPPSHPNIFWTPWGTLGSFAAGPNIDL